MVFRGLPSLLFNLYFETSDMKVSDLAENEQKVKYSNVTGGYPD